MVMPNITLEQLRKLIGAHLQHQGVDCSIIEVLEDGPTLVLQECSTHSVIQANQHGEGHRRVAPTFTLPVWDGLTGQMNSELAGLLGSNRQ